MRCAQCGAELKEGVLFCRDCGAKVEKIRKKHFCIDCGAEYSEGTRFCSSCGANLILQSAVSNTNNSSKNASYAIPTLNSKDNSLDSVSASFSSGNDGNETTVPYDYVAYYEDTSTSNPSLVEAEGDFSVSGANGDSTNPATETFEDSIAQEKSVFVSSGAAEKKDEINSYPTSLVKHDIQQILSEDGSFFDKINKIILVIWQPLDLFCRIVAVAALISVFLLIISVLTHRGIFSFVIQAGTLSIATLLHEGKIKASNPKLKYFILGFAIFLVFLNARSCLESGSSARRNKGNTVSSSDDSVDDSGISITIPNISEDQETNVKEGIYSYPIKNYIGKNLASFGKQYGDYMVDEYGSAYLRLIYVSPSGVFINPDEMDDLKNFVVLNQNIDAGTNFVLVNERDSDGEPLSFLVSYQNYEEIVLAVKRVGEVDEQNVELTRISPTLDRHEWHVRDYVGRNLASFGITKKNARIDEYGKGELRLMYVSDDGRYIDPTVLSELRQYVVTSQETEPNTVLSFEYAKDSEGNEFSILIDSQNMEEIVLHVQKIDDAIIAGYKDIPEVEKKDETINSSEGNTASGVEKQVAEVAEDVSSAEEEKVAVPADAYSYRHDDYKDVKKSLSEAGFTNISIKKQYDIIWGWTKEGEVESVSIDGKTDFAEGDMFKKDAPIVITYHLKYEDDPENQTKEEMEEAEKEVEEAMEDVLDDLDIVEKESEKTINDSEQKAESELVSYSTNTINTVKDGNSGVYSYIKEGPQYDLYYIIDFDEGYVYSFDKGSSEDCDRLKIESGDLKSGLTITYHSEGDVWSYELYFEDQDNPEHLIMKDNDGFTYDYYPTDLEDAIKLKDTKYVHDY